MEHHIDAVIDKPYDYKKCQNCGRINWYENRFCISCGCEKFSPLTKQQAKGLREVYTSNYMEV